jgi:hypothetical protein
MTPDVVIAEEPFLPAPPIIKTGIYAREGLNVRRITPLVEILEGLLCPPTSEPSPVEVQNQVGEKPSRRCHA